MANAELSCSQILFGSAKKATRQASFSISPAGRSTVVDYVEIETVCNRYLDGLPNLQAKQHSGEKALEYLADKKIPTGWVYAVFPQEVAQSLVNLRSMTHALSFQRQGIFLRDLGEYITTSIAVHGERSCHKAINLAKREGMLAAKVICDLLPDEDVNARGFKSFSEAFTRRAQAINVMDTFYDFDRDFASGKLSCNQNVVNRLRFGMAGANLTAINALKSLYGRA